MVLVRAADTFTPSSLPVFRSRSTVRLERRIRTRTRSWKRTRKADLDADSEPEADLDAEADADSDPEAAHYSSQLPPSRPGISTSKMFDVNRAPL